MAKKEETQKEFLENLRQKFYERQKGCCAICGWFISIRKAHLDHNHNTGRYRGLLCVSCNLGIGQLKDDLYVLRRAVEYLEEDARHSPG